MSNAIDIDAWIDRSRSTGVPCKVCSHESSKTLREILERMKAKGVGNIAILRIYQYLESIHPGTASAFSDDTLRKHLSRHEPIWVELRAKQ